MKTFLSYCVDRGIKVNPMYSRFQVLREEPDFTFLTEDEVNHLYSLDLNGNTRLIHIRDVFCFQCFTGLRFSDLERLRPEHIENKGISMRAQKTGESLFVPLIPPALKILDRYQDEYPTCLPVISKQRTNQYLKELGQLAEFNTKIITVNKSGSRRIEETHEKWELLTTHTGRRTFVMMCLSKGLQPQEVMKMTGHKSLKTFMRYVNVTRQMLRSRMDEVCG